MDKSLRLSLIITGLLILFGLSVAWGYVLNSNQQVAPLAQPSAKTSPFVLPTQQPTQAGTSQSKPASQPQSNTPDPELVRQTEENLRTLEWLRNYNPTLPEIPEFVPPTYELEPFDTSQTEENLRNLTPTYVPTPPRHCQKWADGMVCK